MILKIFNPKPLVGGLEISDSILRFARFARRGIQKFDVQILPGVVVNGKIRDRREFMAALKKLRAQIDFSGHAVYVAVSLPASVVQTRIFPIPALAASNLVDEAVQLNLHIASPTDLKKNCYGYEVLNPAPGSSDQLLVLAAFADAEIVEEFSDAIKSANFWVLAAEFPALSLARFIKNEVGDLKRNADYLVTDISGDGLNLLVVRNGKIYFNYFNSWSELHKEMGGRQLNSKDVKDFIRQEIKKVTHFYTTKLGRPIKQVLSLNESTPSAGWSVALGAALRGWSLKETSISLCNNKNVSKKYRWDSVLNFVKISRNFVLSLLSIVFFIYLTTDLTLLGRSYALKKNSQDGSLVSWEEVQKYQKDVQEFNSLVEQVSQAQTLAMDRSPFFNKLRLLAGSAVTFDKITLNQDSRLVISGRGTNEKSVLNFKNLLEKQANFQDVVLPLSDLKTSPDGKMAFVVNFTLATP